MCLASLNCHISDFAFLSLLHLPCCHVLPVQFTSLIIISLWRGCWCNYVKTKSTLCVVLRCVVRQGDSLCRFSVVQVIAELNDSLLHERWNIFKYLRTKSSRLLNFQLSKKVSLKYLGSLLFHGNPHLRSKARSLDSAVGYSLCFWLSSHPLVWSVSFGYFG